MLADTGGTRPHFTYMSPTSDSLQQGDVLRKSDELKALLERVHPHYLQEDYTHFLVLTQSCDLVMRQSVCKTRYVTLAAVRPLSLLIRREVESIQSDFERIAGVCRKAKRKNVENMVARLFNNNESEYFYLHEEPVYGLEEPSCAFLRLSIALRAYEHYELCMASRILSLAEGFQAKLGWLVGNMYSRVGTVDWVPENCTDEQFKAMVDNALNQYYKWIDDDKLKVAEKTVDKDLRDPEQLTQFIENVKVPSKRETLIEALIVVLKDADLIGDAKTERLIRQKIKNDPTLSPLLPK